MATNAAKEFKGRAARVSLFGGGFMLMADFGMAIFEPALRTVSWYIFAVMGYIGVLMVIPFLVWLYRRLS